MKKRNPLSSKKANTTILFTLVFGGILVLLSGYQMSAVQSKNTLDKNKKATIFGDEFLRRAVKSTSNLVNAQSLSVLERVGKFPKIINHQTQSNMYTIRGGQGSDPYYIRFNYLNPKFAEFEDPNDPEKTLNNGEPQNIVVDVSVLEVNIDKKESANGKTIYKSNIKIEAKTTYNYSDLTGNVTQTITRKLGAQVRPFSRLWSKVSVGRNHSCALSSDGLVFCWGSNQYGQLGNNQTGSNKKFVTPQLVSGGLRFIDIKVGDQYSCGLVIPSNSNGIVGTPYCWGYNGFGQLGTGDTNSRGVPTKIQKGQLPSTENVEWLSVGKKHVCTSVKNSRGVYCWGQKKYLGVGSSDANSSIATPVSVQFDSAKFSQKPFIHEIDVTTDHTCVITGTNSNRYSGTRSVACWGSNQEGQIGFGSPAMYGGGPKWEYQARKINLDRQAYTGYTWSKINLFTWSEGTCGYFYEWGSYKKIYCWGNFNGQSAASDTTPNSANWSPNTLFNNAYPSNPYNRELHSLSFDSYGVDGTIWAIITDRSNSDGWISNGSVYDTENLRLVRYKDYIGNVPSGQSEILETPDGEISYLDSFSYGIGDTTSGASNHACFVADNSRLLCWGKNDSGQLGFGDQNKNGEIILDHIGGTNTNETGDLQDYTPLNFDGAVVKPMPL